jgi:site-specific DNA-methyltransferase (adenine-specific)
VKGYIKDSMKLYNMDCMEGMKQYPDNYFDICIVDPSYGIGVDGQKKSTSTHGGRKEYKFKGWDNSAPDHKYFNELFRVSKNQIVWGANYMSKYLPASMGWIFWDKGQRICNSDGELAYSSFNRALRVIELNMVEIQLDGAIHPTQKPVKLYSWLLQNYSSPEHKILDTHLGSASHAIAWHYFQKGGEFVGFELDEEYFDKSIKRIEQETAQISLF